MKGNLVVGFAFGAELEEVALLFCNRFHIFHLSGDKISKGGLPSAVIPPWKILEGILRR
jgi:hypothetical protein